jgi:menaquinone-dependent protoporphyrinogen oxidase
MMKTLVAFASRHGSTREIAQMIAYELRRSGAMVDLEEAKDAVDIQAYDAVILGSAVYMGDWLGDAHRFVDRHFVALTRLPVWFFSSGPLGQADPHPHGDPLRIWDLIQAIRPQEHRVFDGKLDKHVLGLGERLVATMVHAPEGDFRDWDAVREWARGIGAALAAQPAATS